MARLVYRGGSPTDDNLTPRPDRDTRGRPGQAPGLSTWSALERAVAPGGKAQVIDLDLLAPPLAGLPDDPSLGGTEGHVSIAPISETGEVAIFLLDEWANRRGTGSCHPLTESVKQAIVDLNARRPR